MRRKDREISDPAELRRILREGKYAVIAMCRGNEPYVVTLSYGYDQSEHACYFHAALQGQKIEFIRENPQVCATVIEDGGYLADQCAHRYATVVLRGEMTLLQDRAEKEHGLNVILNQLERNPAPIKARTVKDPAAYDRVAVLRLAIRDCSGKRGS
jgi:nitroimidazol reductase NimA-like FMN-containing flavoprotein (pyridoxamine 5'-phosphate oxidase superfamily)